MSDATPPRRRFASVRVRTTAGAVVAVIVALGLTGAFVVNRFYDSQLQTIERSLDLQAKALVGQLDGRSAAEVLALIDDGRAESGVFEDEDDDFTQVVAADGTVEAATQGFTEMAALRTAPTSGQTIVEIARSREPGSFLIVALSAGERLLIVGASVDELGETQGNLIAALLLGGPLLVIAIGAVVWFVTGRALRPVDAIRQRVDEIGGEDLDLRVPEPATGDEIARLASTMNEMLGRLQSADERQRRFVSDAAHELRTPIAVIRHQLEVGLRTGDGDALRLAVDEALDEDVKMQRLVDDLLALARLEHASSASIAERPVVELADVAIEEAHRVTSSHSIEVHAEVAGRVRGDADALTRVVRNLVDNALRYAASSVAVSVEETASTVSLHVDDDGPGVPVADRALVFERFGRTDEARNRSDGGSGLGLAIAAEIASDHTAGLAVSDSPTLGGARFTLTLAAA